MDKVLVKAIEDRDMVAWFAQCEKNKDYDSVTHPLFLKDSAMWNTMYTHEEEIVKHYKNWEPHCCNTQKSCRTMCRMDKTSYGWHCTSCGLKIGKHLRRLDVRAYEIYMESEDAIHTHLVSSNRIIDDTPIGCSREEAYVPNIYINLHAAHDKNSKIITSLLKSRN